MTIAMTGTTSRQEPERRIVAARSGARAALLLTAGLVASVVAALAAVVSL